MTTTLPDWFAARRAAALSRHQALPAPKRGDEAWRFSNLKQLDFSGFAPGAEVPASAAADLVARSEGAAATSAKLVFANDRLLLAESRLPQGVVCLPLSEALVSHAALVESRFMKQEARLGSAKFAAWHEANVRDGLFLHVPDGVTVEDPVEVHHWISDAGTVVFPHTLVVTGKGARVRVTEIFHSASDLDPGLAVACCDLSAGEGSFAGYSAVQALNEVTRGIQIQATTAAGDAAVKSFVLNIGASWARNESITRLEGPGSRSDMLSVSVPAREQEYDQRTFQHHVSPGANSDLLFKNILHDDAKTVFSGLIFVDEGAHYTDAYQTCRNLLMSDSCEANSMPGLEINADQVKCSHGSTSAQVSDEEIFYLRARGIAPAQARRLIARGFSVEVVERLDHAPTEELMLRFLDGKFASIAGDARG